MIKGTCAKSLTLWLFVLIVYTAWAVLVQYIIE